MPTSASPRIITGIAHVSSKNVARSLCATVQLSIDKQQHGHLIGSQNAFECLCCFMLSYLIVHLASLGRNKCSAIARGSSSARPGTGHPGASGSRLESWQTYVMSLSDHPRPPHRQAQKIFFAVLAHVCSSYAPLFLFFHLITASLFALQRSWMILHHCF